MGKKKIYNIYSKSPCRISNILTDLGHLHNFAEYTPKCLCMSLKTVWSRFTGDLCSFCIVHIKWFLYQMMLPGCAFPGNILQNELVLGHSVCQYILLCWIKECLFLQNRFSEAISLHFCARFSRSILAAT